MRITTIRAQTFAAYVFLLLAAIGTVRSCIHFLPLTEALELLTGMDLSVQVQWE